MKKAAVWIAIVTVIVGIYVLKSLNQAGVFRSVEPLREPPFACERIGGVPGPEDIVVHHAEGIAFISSDDRRASLRGTPAPGAIYRYRLEGENPGPENITPSLPFDFHPQGIDVYSGGGNMRLFVINNRKDGKYVEIFDFLNGKLKHAESLRNELITSPNDIAAVGSRSFYVTNDSGLTSGIGRTIENYLRLPLSYVAYYDGKNYRKAARNIVFANGIALSRDGMRLFVASTLGRAIEMYDRDPVSGELAFNAEFALAACPDNISIDEQGSLWVGTHPQIMKIMPHRDDPAALSPSQVVKIEFAKNGAFTITDVYRNQGETISASSVGAASAGRLIIGTIYDSFFLDCRARK